MKKIYLSILALSFTGVAMSQQMYGSLTVGYGLQNSKEVLGTHETVDASFNSTESNIYGTYGSGINLALTPGYMFSDHFGAELGLNYLMGGDIESNRVDFPTGSFTATSKSSQFRLMPSFVLTTGTSGLNAYGKLGLVLPVGGKTVTDVYNNINPNSVEEYSVESSGQFSLGYMGTFGVSFGLSDNLSFFGELQGINLRIKSKSSSITSYTMGGTDVMGTLTTYDKETVYVDELNSSSNNSSYNTNPNDGAAKESLASTSNYNGMFINVGLKFNF